MTMTTPTTTGKLANAVQVAGNLYQITYPYTADCDGPVPYAYLRRLARDGYTVAVDPGPYDGEIHTVSAD